MTSGGRCGLGTLRGYLGGSLNPAEERAFERHLEECTGCASIISETRKLADALEAGDFDAALRASQTWELDSVADAISIAASQMIADASRATIETLDVLTRSPREWRHLASATPATVRTLLRLADRHYGSRPARAHELTTLAVDIADLLPARTTEVMRVRCEAWRDKGVALAGLGRYEEVIAALDIADGFATELPDSDLERARNDYTRADTLSKMGRIADAVSLIQRAAEVFEVYGLRSSVTAARFIEANIRWRRGDTHEPLSIFRELYAAARDGGDALTLARLHVNIGWCLTRLGEYDAAEEQFREGAIGLARAGAVAEKINAEWGSARAIAARGELQTGARRLGRVRRDFARLAMAAEEILVGLEIVELQIAVGRSSATLAAACRTLATRAAKAGMGSAHATALAYLRELARERQLTIEAVHYVRQYLEDVPSYPTLPFSPPLITTG